MPIKTYQPTTASRRLASVATFEEITRNKPERSLLKAFKGCSGRNSAGRITVRHRGGGQRRLLRVIDFKRDKLNVPARVASIEYDPNRSARIALLHYADGEKRYILAPVGLAVGATLLAGAEAEPSVGNVLPLARVPLGIQIHNIELLPGRGGQLARGAGQAATLMSREGDYANVKLPSGEVRRLHVNCRSTIGQVGNVDHASVRYGKAGRARWLGIRPTVRGRAMNPVDHPLGGGEGKSTGGHPRSPWGQYAKGMKTRRPHRRSEPFIVARRK
ncbi:MAG: 50S ribosomal protein L2 [Lentisphaerae bacterium]|nr:50S ribosomal protein L2 [Lentisphaerota bacterium]